MGQYTLTVATHRQKRFMHRCGRSAATAASLSLVAADIALGGTQVRTQLQQYLMSPSFEAACL